MEGEARSPAQEGTAAENTRSAGHDGHRQRILKRYEENGLPGFKEHEVLEMLLFRSIPRSNTNPLAHDILELCGSVEAVLEKAAENGFAVPGAGAKTMEMLRETRDSVESDFRQMLLQSEGLDPWQFYTAAVWFLRRYPDRVLLVVCNSAGRTEEVGLVGEAAPAEILKILRTLLQPDMLCHMACVGGAEALAGLRKDVQGGRMGMILSLTEGWVPVWL